MGVWTVIFIVATVLILGGWILNARRLAQKNDNWERRSPKMFGRGGPPVDEDNRAVAEKEAGSKSR